MLNRDCTVGARLSDCPFVSLNCMLEDKKTFCLKLGGQAYYILNFNIVIVPTTVEIRGFWKGCCILSIKNIDNYIEFGVQPETLG